MSQQAKPEHRVRDFPRDTMKNSRLARQKKKKRKTKTITSDVKVCLLGVEFQTQPQQH